MQTGGRRRRHTRSVSVTRIKTIYKKSSRVKHEISLFWIIQNLFVEKVRQKKKATSSRHTQNVKLTNNFSAKRCEVASVGRHRRYSYKVRQSYLSRTVWPRIAKFYRHIHAELPDIYTGYDVTNYYSKNAEKRLQVEFIEKGLREDRSISRGLRG